MGRYYNGDIEGKLWFGVQSSYAPERFGSMAQLAFTFCEDDIPDIEEEIASIKENLGEYKEKFDKFFDEHPSYNEEMLISAGFPAGKIGLLLSEYADLLLGEKILKCVKETGSCCFHCDR